MRMTLFHIWLIASPSTTDLRVAVSVLVQSLRAASSDIYLCKLQIDDPICRLFFRYFIKLLIWYFLQVIKAYCDRFYVICIILM